MVKNITLDPFQLALEGIKFGAQELFNKAAIEKNKKASVFRMNKELEESMINLGTTLGGRASARGLGAGHYSNYLNTTSQIGRKQIDFSKYEAELGEVGYFTDLYRKLTGGRTISKISKDMGQSRIDIQKLMS